MVPEGVPDSLRAKVLWPCPEEVLYEPQIAVKKVA
jgi:hypothetical protein